MENKKIYLVSIIAGIILLLLGAFYNIVRSINEIISIGFTTAGVMIVVISTIRYNKFGAGVIQDERTRKLSQRAISYSWLFTFVIINIIFWIDFFQIVKLNSGQIIALILYPMLLSAAFLQYWFKRKGVIDEN